MTDKTIDPGKQKELTGLSTFYFIISVLLIRFFINLLTATALEINDISFEYRLFGNIFHSQSGSHWTTEKIFLIYAFIPAGVFVLGILLFRALKANSKFTWKERLLLSWLAFVMVNQLPFRFVAGTFLFSDFGYAYITFIPSLVVRIVLSLFVVIIAIILRIHWIELFLKTSFTAKIFDNIESIKNFISRVFILPWIIGFFVLTLFTFTGHYWGWLVMLGAMGAVVTPVFNGLLPVQPPKIRKSDKVIFSRKHAFIRYAVVIALLLFLSTIGI